MSTKLGVGSSASGHQPVVMAPVALPGFTKNLPSISYASNLCVPPHSRTSTSICRAAINRLSASPGGIIVWPWVKPIRRLPCVTTFESARFGASTSKSPLTICKSGAMPRRNSYVSFEVMLPRQRICPIFPGARSFLNCSWGQFICRVALKAQVRKGPEIGVEIRVAYLCGYVLVSCKFVKQMIAVHGALGTYRSSIWYEKVTQR